ncbi:hypothetical protein GCM10010372_63380 [Streptomyces tauricus]|nr:hypothetical protein GCM10010372_63380 [Streptomyces tauricus]
MLDLTLRLLAWVLNVCTPRPSGRHRLGSLPPLRFIPVPPPRFSSVRGRRAAEHGIHGVPVAAR